jgi:diketogulonate reductase-like aldo/keto reductase
MGTVTLRSGEAVPAFGLGTWHMGEHVARQREEVAVLAHGIDAGATLIDTAEMYADGGAERVVGEAIAGKRDRVFIVSKVYPHNAGRQSAMAACERSLRRLGTETIDMYLLHWRGSIPLAETVEAFERLRAAGKIRHWGVSNLDCDDMRELLGVPAGAACTVNQVLYNLSTRGIEWDLEPLCRERGIPVMAYSPIDQGRVLSHPGLKRLASSLDLTAAQLAVAWTLRLGQVITIPKAASRRHLDENLAARAIELSAETLAALDGLFAPPTGPEPLAML